MFLLFLFLKNAGSLYPKIRKLKLDIFSISLNFHKKSLSVIKSFVINCFFYGHKTKAIMTLVFFSALLTIYIIYIGKLIKM